MAVKLTNLARSKLALAITAEETELRVLTGHGSRFPVLIFENSLRSMFARL